MGLRFQGALVMTETVEAMEKADATRPGRSAERASIQSVDRAVTLLETIAELGGETTLSKLANRTGLNISTCHHLLATLVQRGFVTKGLGRRGYALGARILYLSHACLQVDLPRRSQAALDRINEATGEAVHLAALQGDELVTVLKREARHAVRVDVGTLGSSDAAHATATGKAMLAWLPEDEIRRIVTAQGMTKFTPSTITDFTELIENLRLVRRNGFSIDREEFRPGVVCVGAAIRDHSGAVVGSISASTPSMRASEEHLALMRDEVIAATRALSIELGAPPAGHDRAQDRSQDRGQDRVQDCARERVKPL
jgi:IclR family acetate operon transcriptional repressor